MWDSIVVSDDFPLIIERIPPSAHPICRAIGAHL